MHMPLVVRPQYKGSEVQCMPSNTPLGGGKSKGGNSAQAAAPSQWTYGMGTIQRCAVTPMTSDV